VVPHTRLLRYFVFAQLSQNTTDKSNGPPMKSAAHSIFSKYFVTAQASRKVSEITEKKYVGVDEIDAHILFFRALQR
jgi:hypothetical protein